MKIAVIADTHDNLPNISRALEEAVNRGAEAVLHLGDIVSPFAAQVLAAGGLPVTAVFGNNDGEKAGLSKILDIAEPPRRVELSGRRIIMTHDVEGLPRDVTESADAVFFGHTHRSGVRRENGRLELNPGECGGWLYGYSSFAIVDLDTMEVDLVGF